MSLYRECCFYKHFDNKNLKDVFDLVNWEDFLQISKQNLYLSFELYNQKTESWLKTYYPKTILTNTNLKETTKPWMIKAYLKSIKLKKNRIYSFEKPPILMKKLKSKKDSKFTKTM